MGDNKYNEDRGKDGNRFFYTPQVENYKSDNQATNEK
jgi:hypothetical protein